MREILDDLEQWRAQGRRIALARVVDIDGSGPRMPGAAMAVDEDGEVIGSVSGGCVEGAVVTEALDLLAANAAGRLVTFGYSEDEAFAVGLTCGGTVQLFVEELGGTPGDGSDVDELLTPLFAALRAQRPVALVTAVAGANVGATMLVDPDAPPIGSLGHAHLDRVVSRDALAAVEAGRTGIRRYGPRGEARREDVTLFVESFTAPPRMLIFGAVDFTGALMRVASVLGYQVTVCDARAVFATTRRFPLADVVVDWPHRFLERVGPTLGPRDAVCVLTHDHKFDVPAIVAALATNVGYLGVMGSRRTHAERVERLTEAGVDATELARVRGPIGLDLGAASPEETAISICAEIIAARTGRSARPLSESDGPIHELQKDLAPWS